MDFVDELQALAARLAGAGFVAADEEAVELLARAGGDRAVLDELVARRLTGEPLAWITGAAPFCGRWVRVDRGVYVPRWQSEPLALRAAELLPADGVAADLCTGAGPIALTLMAGRPGAQVIATDLDEQAVACARSNGVDARHGDLFDPVPPALRGCVDVVTGVLPYVPTPDLPLLQRDTLRHESARSYDGGPDGADVLRRAVAGAAEHLRPGGALLLELGGDQHEVLAPDLARHGFADVTVHRDGDGDVRGIEARLGA